MCKHTTSFDAECRGARTTLGLACDLYACLHAALTPAVLFLAVLFVAPCQQQHLVWRLPRPLLPCLFCQQVAEIPAHEKDVWAVAFDPHDSHLLATCSYDGAAGEDARAGR